MSNQNIAFVIVHGLAFAPPCYQPLRTALEKAGYQVIIPRLPSLGEGVVGATMAGEVAAVRSAMAPALDAGKDVVLIGHSYGGMVITPTALGYSKTERAAQGLKGGIKAVVYMEAFAAAERGRYPMDLVWGCGSEIPPMFQRLEVDGKLTDNIPGNNRSEPVRQAAQFMFFNTCTPEQADSCFASLEGMSLGAALEPAEVVPADLKTSLTYIIGDQDNAMPVAVAEMFAAATPGMKTVRMDTGHAPFVSQVGELVGILEAIGRE